MAITLIDNTSNLDNLISEIEVLPDLEIKKGIFVELLKDDFGEYEAELANVVNQLFTAQAELLGYLKRFIEKSYPLGRREDFLKSVENDYKDVVQIEAQGLENILLRSVSAISITSPVLLLAGLKFNATTVLTRGITSGLSPSSGLFDTLKKVWKKAIEKIHPYQVGPTNQGTIHCITNLKMLNRLNSLATMNMDMKRFNPLGSNKVTIEEGVALSMAAALHDTMKASVLPTKVNDHHKEGSIFISNNPSLLEIKGGYEDPVAKIVLGHNKSQDLEKFMDSTVGPKTIRIPELCALFRFADVLDITFSRVSDIYKEINLKDLKGEKKGREKPLIAREQVNKVILRDPRAKKDDVTVIYFSKNKELEDIVKDENKNLNDFTSSGGCSARKILSAIGIPNTLVLMP